MVRRNMTARYMPKHDDPDSDAVVHPTSAAVSESVSSPLPGSEEYIAEMRRKHGPPPFLVSLSAPAPIHAVPEDEDSTCAPSTGQ